MWDDLQHSIIHPSTRRRQGADVRFERLRGDKRPGWARAEDRHEKAATRRDKALPHLKKVVGRLLAHPTPFAVKRLARFAADPAAPAEIRVMAATGILRLAYGENHKSEATDSPER